MRFNKILLASLLCIVIFAGCGKKNEDVAREVAESEAENETGTEAEIVPENESESDTEPVGIFVATDGNDSNTGSYSSPYATIQKALDVVGPGETIYIREGTYTGMYEWVNSGEQYNPITIRPYKQEKVYLKGISGTDGAIFHMNNCSYINIQGLDMGDFSSVNAFGILMDESEHDIDIRNNLIHDIATTKPGENEGGEANGILCIGYADSAEGAIHDINIEKNEVYNNTTGWCESVSVAGNVENVYIYDNVVHDNTNIGIDFYGNAGYCPVKELDQPRNCEAISNTVYNCASDYAECAGIYVDGAIDTIIRENNVYDCQYGIEIGAEELVEGYPVKNITVIYNFIQDNSCGGIRIGGYDADTTGTVTDSLISYNTLYDNGSGDGAWNGELNIEKVDGITVKNNTFFKADTEYPMVASELDEKYVKNLTFEDNTYCGGEGGQDIYFELYGKSTEGVEAFNALTGGSDKWSL